MSKKLILPAEVKVCATCSYWDGERKVSEDNHVVVVAEDASGECLVQSAPLPGLAAFPEDRECLWEPLEADAVDESAAVPSPRKVVGG